MALAIIKDWRTLITALQDGKKNMNFKIALQTFFASEKLFLYGYIFG